MQRFALGVGLAVLILCWATSLLSGWMPLAIDYQPHGFGWMILGGCGVLIAIHAAARRLPLAVVAAAVPLGILVLAGGAVAYGIYHADHPDPMVPDGWFGHLERHPAFHRQLAIPAFTAVACGTVILGSAWRSRRRRTGR